MADGLGELDDAARIQFERALAEVPGSEFRSFIVAWHDLADSRGVIASATAGLDMVDEPSEDGMGELKEWFSILMENVSTLSERSQRLLLSRCGAACAGNITPKFQEIWLATGELKEFTAGLNEQLGEGTPIYSYVNERTVDVTYPKCFCPLVGFGLLDTPTLCACSEAWLKTNFEGALLRTTTVEKSGTVLDGEKVCSLRVSLAD